MKAPCPVCQKDFVFSVDAEDAFGNMMDCTHCRSTLKWNGQTLELLKKHEVLKENSAGEVLETAEEPSPSGNIQNPVLSPGDRVEPASPATENASTEEEGLITPPPSSSEESGPSARAGEDLQEEVLQETAPENSVGEPAGSAKNHAAAETFKAKSGEDSIESVQDKKEPVVEEQQDAGRELTGPAAPGF